LLRAQGRINKLGLRQKFSKEEAAEATQAAEAVVKSDRALGQVILSAGYNGEIKVCLRPLSPFSLHVLLGSWRSINLLPVIDARSGCLLAHLNHCT